MREVAANRKESMLAPLLGAGQAAGGLLGAREERFGNVILMGE